MITMLTYCTMYGHDLKLSQTPNLKIVSYVYIRVCLHKNVTNMMPEQTAGFSLPSYDFGIAQFCLHFYFIYLRYIYFHIPILNILKNERFIALLKGVLQRHNVV